MIGVAANTFLPLRGEATRAVFGVAGGGSFPAAGAPAWRTTPSRAAPSGASLDLFPQGEVVL